MNKANLIKQVSEKTNIDLKAAKAIVDTFFDAMSESLEKGEGIEIKGFGSFSVRHYGAYKGRNHKTGKNVDVPLKKHPNFKVERKMKRLLNTESG